MYSFIRKIVCYTVLHNSLKTTVLFANLMEKCSFKSGYKCSEEVQCRVQYGPDGLPLTRAWEKDVSKGDSKCSGVLHGRLPGGTNRKQYGLHILEIMHLGNFRPFWTFLTALLKSSLSLFGSINYPDTRGVKNTMSLSHNKCIKTAFFLLFLLFLKFLMASLESSK